MAADCVVCPTYTFTQSSMGPLEFPVPRAQCAATAGNTGTDTNKLHTLENTSASLTRETHVTVNIQVHSPSKTPSATLKDPHTVCTVAHVLK